MRDEPQGVDVVGALAAGWGISAQPRYSPVGFGGHHWVAGDWFVTVNDRSLDRLEPALDTALALSRAGLDFVVAPIPTSAGATVWRGPGYAVSLYPFVEGEAGEFGPHRPEDLPELRRILAELHGVSVDAPRAELELPGRDVLESDGPWADGPFASAARQLLAERAGYVRELLAAYDSLVEHVRDAPWVVTHGEPHPGNVIRTPGGLRLIDWDTVALAPAERDWWHLGENGSPDGCAFYRLRWKLADVVEFVEQFRQPHEDSGDVRAAWGYLQGYLRPEPL